MHGMIQLALSLASVPCAVLPMVGFLFLVWWMDRYAREPVWLFGLTFLWGATGAVVIAGIVNTLADFIGRAAIGGIDKLVPAHLDWLGESFGPVIVAPLVEEPSKAVFLLFVAGNRQFASTTDGFVYGAAAGLGFGMTENFMYFLSVASAPDAWLQTVVIRTLYSAVMHAAACSLTGAAIGFARYRGCGTLAFVAPLGLFLAMSMHATWNGVLTAGALLGNDYAQMFNLAAFPVLFFLVFCVFQACLLFDARGIRRELEEEAAAGRIPADDPPKIASWIWRHSAGWIPEGVPKKLYLETATSLAQRKWQVRLMGKRATAFYRDEVERLQRQLEKIRAVKPSPR